MFSLCRISHTSQVPTKYIFFLCIQGITWNYFLCVFTVTKSLHPIWCSTFSSNVCIFICDEMEVDFGKLTRQKWCLFCIFLCNQIEGTLYLLQFSMRIDRLFDFSNVSSEIHYTFYHQYDGPRPYLKLGNVFLKRIC